MCRLFGRMTTTTPSRINRITMAVTCTGAFLTMATNGQIVTVAPGFDLFQTSAGTTFNGFDFKGVPLGTYNFGGSVGTQPTGLTDTILQRTSAVTSTVGNSGTTPLVVEALQLESTSLINFGGAGLDDYFVTLQSTHGGTASTGSLSITFNAVGSGTFSSSFDVFFDIHKHALDGPIIYSSDFTLSAAPNNMWSSTAPAGSVIISGANYHLNGTDSTQDFFPIGVTQHDSSGAAHHYTMPANTPEPWQYGLVSSAALGVFAFLRRRQA